MISQHAPEFLYPPFAPPAQVARYRHVFGPVLSRRLGRSLGIDTVPAKVCNWNCVYCQLGRTHPLTNQRRNYVRNDEVLAEARERIDQLGPDALDWITFVASGEGTLHTGFGPLLREVKRISPVPVAVITNGSLLAVPTVREDLACADAVLPTLDAADRETFRRINRPHRALGFDKHVEGLRAFARMPDRGHLWIEVMLVAGVNDSKPALHRLASLLDEINPDEIHLTFPTRCPVEAWVRAPDSEVAARALAILGARASFAAPEGAAASRGSEPADLVAIVRRHPLPLGELRRLFPGWSHKRIRSWVGVLHARGRIRFVDRKGIRYVVGNDLRYPEEGLETP